MKNNWVNEKLNDQMQVNIYVTLPNYICTLTFFFFIIVFIDCFNYYKIYINYRDPVRYRIFAKLPL